MQIDQNIVFIQILYASRCFCMKYLDENNNILGVDTADLTFGCVQTLETRPRTELFRIHIRQCEGTREQRNNWGQCHPLLVFANPKPKFLKKYKLAHCFK